MSTRCHCEYRISDTWQSLGPGARKARPLCCTAAKHLLFERGAAELAALKQQPPGSRSHRKFWRLIAMRPLPLRTPCLQSCHCEYRISGAWQSLRTRQRLYKQLRLLRRRLPPRNDTRVIARRSHTRVVTATQRKWSVAIFSFLRATPQVSEIASSHY